MKPAIRVEIVDRQQDVAIAASILNALAHAVVVAWPMLGKQALSSHVLDRLEEISLVFVDEYDSARIHLEFMAVPGATDVITFQHGELLICPAVALRQAGEYNEPLTRELLRYVVHGLLHLAGYEDDSDERRLLMESVQESMVKALWSVLEGA